MLKKVVNQKTGCLSIQREKKKNQRKTMLRNLVSPKGVLLSVYGLTLSLPKVSKMTYSESETDSNFAIELASNFDFSSSEPNSESESDFSSVFMNVYIFIFFILYLHSSK